MVAGYDQLAVACGVNSLDYLEGTQFQLGSQIYTESYSSIYSSCLEKQILAILCDVEGQDEV